MSHEQLSGEYRIYPLDDHCIVGTITDGHIDVHDAVDGGVSERAITGEAPNL